MKRQSESTAYRGTKFLGAVAGILSASLALGAAELLAAFVGAGSSPVVAVGGEVVDATPLWLKDFAIRTFGAADKLVLLASVLAVVMALAAVAGALAVRRLPAGLTFVAGLAVAGAAAALVRPTASVVDALPSLLGGAAGAVALVGLLAPLRDGGERDDIGAQPTGPKRRPLARRAFVLGGVATAGVAAAAGFGGRSLRLRRSDVAASRSTVVLPAPRSAAAAIPAGATLDVPGITPFTTPVKDFYRVDTALVLPRVSAESWRLRVHGDVDREIELDFDALLRRTAVERDITLTCVSNEVGGKLAGTARWLGTPLADLLREAGVRPGADQLLSTSTDGMTIGTPLSAVLDGRDALLAYGMNGKPLEVEHGFPARMIVPGLYGYVSATKWVIDLEVTRFDAVDAYWVKRGWAADGPIKTMSRIDTPRPLSTVRAGKVTVAGVAWAQHRGVDRVEVRVDGGEWRAARLAGDAGVDLWRQWSWTWDAKPGSARLEVRATDRSGAVQSERRTRPFPAGATGWHSVVVTVT